MALFEVVPVEQQRPLNSVLLNLNGKEELVHRDYIRCLEHYRNWNIEMAILHENNVSKSEGRNGWPHGYYATKGIYEFANSSRTEPYISHPECSLLPFEGNHHVISRRIEQTSIGLNALRDAFNTIWKYNGGTEHEGLREAFGIIVVHVCESMKLQPVFDRICEAFVNPSVRKLATNGDNFITYLITHWRKLSTHVMRGICDPGCSFHIRDFPELSSVLAILPHLAVLHIDGWFDGPFEHDEAINPSHWQLLEPGTDVPSVDDIRE